MKWLLAAWDNLEDFVGGALAIVATGIVIYATFLRYLWSISPSWAIEVVIYLVIWAVFILSSRLVRENGHIGADFIVHRFSFQQRRYIEIATTVLSLVFTIAVLWLSILHVYDLYDFGARSTTALQFPSWISNGAVPVGAALMTLRLLQRLYLLALSPTEAKLDQEGAGQ